MMLAAIISISQCHQVAQQFFVFFFNFYKITNKKSVKNMV